VRLIIILSFAFLISSCISNPATKFYTSYENEKSQEEIVELKKGEKITLIEASSDRYPEVNYKYRSMNYHIFGQSSYTQVIRDLDILKDNLKDQAKTLKATHVIYTIGASDNSVGRTTINATYWAKSLKALTIGISPIDITPKVAKEIERNTGVFLDVIFEDTPAFDANLLKGDILIKIDEYPIKNVKNLTEVFEKIKHKNKFVFTIIRNQKEKIIEVNIK